MIEDSVEFSFKALDQDEASIEGMKAKLQSEARSKVNRIYAAERVDFRKTINFAINLAEGLRTEKRRILEDHGYWPKGSEPGSKEQSSNAS